MIPQDFIQQLLARIDIVELVSRHVQLRRAGANFLGLCPFHGEKSPSFTVSPSKQFYHCFGCGAHGSAIGFLMEHAGLGYVEAIEDLARSAGMAVPRIRPQAGQAGELASAHAGADLFSLLAEAARFYRQRLRDSSRAIDYLKRRGLTGEIAARFGIGYAPDQWRGLEAAVPDYAAPALVQAGLVIESEGDEGRARRFDRFRDRIMFPIRNARGQIIGFGGRVIDAGEPKYMNSPETPVFSKGREVYGLFEAREAIRKEDCVVVVEGYMDVVMLAQHGIGNAVATLGTATTPDHVRKLLRMADRVVFAFDGDAAGRKAASRALGVCLPMASDTRRLDFLFLPPEHDPDSFVREHGEQGWREQLGKTLSLSEWMLRELQAELNLDTPEGRAMLLAQAAPMLQQLGAPALRMQLVHRIAALSQLSSAEVERYLAQQRPASGSSTSALMNAQAGERSVSPGGFSEGAWSDASTRSAIEQGGGAPGRGAADRPWAEQGARGRGGRSAWRPPVPRPPVAAPDLETRARLLLSLYPALAPGLAPPDEWWPDELRQFLDWLLAMPAGGTFASVCEALRGRDPALVSRLERDLLADAGLQGLDEAEAALELSGAIAQLRARRLRQSIDALVAAGIKNEADRERYQLLMAKRRELV
ncbi:MAG: primase [Pseudomonadota bacterium]